MENTLKFNNGHFRIMLVGDPHSNLSLLNGREVEKMQDYLDFQYAALDKVRPDLVILMGDNASAQNEEDLARLLTMITKPYVDHDVPFSFVFGNHDLECNVKDMRTQLKIYSQLKNCVFDMSDVNEYGDRLLSVKSSDGTRDALNIWHFYSGNRAPEGVPSHYDYVKPEQLAWYALKARESAQKNGGTVPAIAIQHIPVPEIMELTEERPAISMLFNATRGQNGYKGKYYVLKQGISGYMGEGPCPPDVNSGEFDAWKKTGDIFAAFFGHDHMNDFMGNVRGITLGQCKTASFKVYGDGFMQGVRVLDLNEDDIRNFTSHMVRFRDLSDGQCRSIHGRNKWFQDRLNVKIDVAEKIAGGVGVALLPVILWKVIRRICNKNDD